MGIATTTTLSLNDITLRVGHMSLESLSLDTAGAACFALLGLPQSGKSSLIKMLAGLIPPVSGKGRILGYNLGDPQMMLDPRIGFLHQATHWPGNLTIDEVIRMTLLRQPDSPFLGDVDWLISRAGLEERRAVPGARLTPIERQRAGLIMLHLCNPQVLILDAPAESDDAEERRLALDLVAYAGRGRSVFFTTSRLADVQAVADKVAVLHHGTIIAQGDSADLFALPHTAIFQVVLRGNTRLVFEQLRSVAWVSRIIERDTGDRREWTLWLHDEGDTPSHLLRAILADHGLKVMEFHQIRPRLDTFLAELGQSAGQP